MSEATEQRLEDARKAMEAATFRYRRAYVELEKAQAHRLRCEDGYRKAADESNAAFEIWVAAQRAHDAESKA